MSKLGDRLAQGSSTASLGSSSPLGKILAGGARGEHVMLPVFGRVWMELAGHETVNEVEGATYAEMTRLGLEPIVATALTYSAERARRTLAACVRDPDDRTKPFGSVEEWGKVDTDVIAACWHSYADVRDRLDPIGSPVALSAEEIAVIEDAVQKKSAIRLRWFGVVKLALYLLTTADRLASSPIPPSTSGEGSPEP